MSIRDDVMRHLERLSAEQKSEKSRGSSYDERDPAWMDGRVLFKADVLDKARRHEADKDLSVLGVLDQVRRILDDPKESRFIPALTFDKEHRYIITLNLRK